jgi:hypothetical protein
MVNNQNPQCGDFSVLQQTLMKSFNQLVQNLCSCGYNYYLYTSSKRPTKGFYTLDLIGELNSNDPYYYNLTQKALLNAWSKQYPGIFIDSVMFNFCFKKKKIIRNFFLKVLQI